VSKKGFDLLCELCEIYMTFEKLKQKWLNDKQKRINRAAELKTALLTRGEPIFKKYGIRKVVLFGSVADERSGRASDIDILVQPLSADKYWDFRRELEDEINATVDIYTDNDDHVFVKKILSRGETVYEIQS
jgi:predicted nucleotidyltransferase